MVNTYQKKLLQFYKEIDNPYFGHITPDDDRFMMGILQIARLAQLQAKIALFQNQSKDAAQIGEYLVVFGYKLEHCKGYLIDCYAGMSLKRAGLELLQEAKANGLSKKDTSMIINKITPYADSCQGFIDSLRMEYSHQKDMGFDQYQLYIKMKENSENFRDKITSIIVLLPFVYKPNQTFRKLAGYYREMIKYVSGKRGVPPKPLKYPHNIFSGNFLGESVLTMVTPTMGTELDIPKKTENIFNRTIAKLRN